MATARALILRAPGANCDVETQFAFESAGAVADRVHINRLREQPSLLHRYQILAVPGGFTYGDDVAAGKILANQLSVFLGDALRKFRAADKLILGICNGFPIAVRSWRDMTGSSCPSRTARDGSCAASPGSCRVWSRPGRSCSAMWTQPASLDRFPSIPTDLRATSPASVTPPAASSA
jgi:hypothetical protein